MSAPASRIRELLALALLLLLGLVPRLIFVTVFPVHPISDFRSLLDFALTLRDVSWIPHSWHWTYFGPGLPLPLSLVLRIVPGAPADVARLTTAVLCGLVPLLPFGIWRGVLPLWTRLLTGGMLALWPGQIFFSGVLAQDNWILPPAVALACLATRSLLARDSGHPVLAGLLYGAGVAVRQEMLVALLPLLAAAAGLGWPETRRARNAVLCGLTAGVLLLLLAAQRDLATGRFALTSEHAGLAVLGSYIPGATANLWADPIPYVASVAPDLLMEHQDRLPREAGRLALREALRRPSFQAERIAATVLELGFTGESASLYWSVQGPETLPAPVQPRGQAFAARVDRWLKKELAAIHALSLASLVLALAWRNRAMLALFAAILLKVGLHAVTVSQGRYFMVATALEILVIALACHEAARRRSIRLPAIACASGLVTAAALFLLGSHAMAWVARRDVDFQRLYRFRLAGPDGSALDCVVNLGRLTALTPSQATFEPREPDPSPGVAASAACGALGARSATPLAIEILDSYAPGGLPGRMLQRVEVDGTPVLDHDLAAEPGSGWLAVPLGTVPSGAPRQTSIRIVAARPDPGAAWGKAASTTFQLARSREIP